MRKIPAPLYLLSIIVSSLISSCQKDPSVDLPGKTSCLLTKAYYFDDNGVATDSLIYTYSNNKLTKASNSYGYFTLEYANDKVTKRNHYETGSPGLVAYDIASYNSDGSLATIKSYFDNSGQLIQYSQYDFSYAGGKLIKFEVKAYDFNSGQLEPYASSTYTYAGNNISQSVNTYAGSGVETYNYEYDTNENYLNKNNALFTDYAFAGELDGSIIPFITSANNVTKVADDTDEFLVSYKLDSNNNFYEFNFDSALASRYFYDCK